MAYKFTFEFVKDYIESFGCVLLSETYENQYQKLRILCKKCKEEYFCTFEKFKNRNKFLCNKCSRIEKGIRSRHDFEFIKEEFKKSGYTIISKYYENCEEPLECEDKEGYRGKLSYSNLRYKYNFGKFKTTNPYYIYNVNLFISYNNYNSKLISYFYNGIKLYGNFECECGEKYTCLIESVLHQDKYRCAKCNKIKSSYCLKLEELFKLKEIDYEEEIYFPQCKDNSYLYFDYCIDISNRFILIEVDGELHYKVGYGGVDGLVSQQKRDNIKDNFCKENDIKLIRFPYWEFKDETYIKKLEREIENSYNYIKV